MSQYSATSSNSTYSLKTQNVIKQIGKDLNLSHKQQEQLFKCITEGKPLNEIRNRSYQPVTEHLDIPAKCQTYSRLRSKATIEASGAYCRDIYRPRPWRVEPKKDKKNLQNLMSYGTTVDLSLVNAKPKPRDVRIPTLTEQFDNIVEEINERKDFLQVMIEMGNEKFARPVMESQILQKIKELETLDQKILEANACTKI